VEAGKDEPIQSELKKIVLDWFAAHQAVNNNKRRGQRCMMLCGSITICENILLIRLI
jgi:hypothetical protein